MLRNSPVCHDPEALRQDFDALMGLYDERDQNAAAIADRLRAFAANGGDKKALKRCVTLARKDREKLAQDEAIFEIYREALGLD